MKKLHKLCLFTAVIIIVFLSIVYMAFLFLLPAIFNSNKIVNKLENYINSKTKIQIKLENFKLKTYPNLKIKVLTDKLNIKDNNNEDLVNAKDVNLELKLLLPEIKSLDVEYVYINESEFKNILKNNKDKKTSDFRIKAFPVINIKKAEIWIDNGKIGNVFVIVSDFKLINKNASVSECTFETEIISDLLRNLVTIGKNGSLILDKESLKANNLEILVGTSSLYLDGKIIDDNKKSDFTLKGENIPTADAQASLLYMLKLKKPGKQFLENFKDFSGTINVNLNIKETGIYGSCQADNLGAVTELFSVPALFKKVIFDFDGKTITSNAQGVLGNEKVIHKFKMENILTSEQEVFGAVNSQLTDNFAKKYIPDLRILNKANANVTYHIKQGKINIDYLLKLAPDSDIIYKNAYLGHRDKNRRLLIETLKEGDKLHLTHYDYSFGLDSSIENIITGEGLFIKKNGHFTPSYLKCKTNGYAPVSVTGSFGRYVSGGMFNGDLKYDFEIKKLIGNFNLKDTKYNDFYVQDAKVLADSKTMNITANGTYLNQLFKSEINALNDFTNKILIYNMDLFLDKYIMGNTDKNKISKKNIDIKDINIEDIDDKVRDADITIEKWQIKVNQIKRGKLKIENILLSGMFKDNIFNFTTKDIKFAKGLINANGKINFQSGESEIDFAANNIDSDTVADAIFNMPNQIKGLAGASLKAKMKHNFQDINAHADFYIKEGYLPQLGSTEFIIKKSKKVKRPIKIKLSEITNIDMSKNEALVSDISGSFDMDNDDLSNICLFAQQSFLSLFIEGDYDISQSYARMNIWGKYDVIAHRKIKILFVPVSLIFKIIFRPEKTKELYTDKLQKIPPIESTPENERVFRVNIEGNLNDKDIKVDLKSLI